MVLIDFYALMSFLSFQIGNYPEGIRAPVRSYSLVRVYENIVLGPGFDLYYTCWGPEGAGGVMTKGLNCKNPSIAWKQDMPAHIRFQNAGELILVVLGGSLPELLVLVFRLSCSSSTIFPCSLLLVVNETSCLIACKFSNRP